MTEVWTMSSDMRYIYTNITERRSWMTIEPQSLSTCEVAPDGGTIIFGLTNSDGTPAQMRLPLSQVGGLAMTLPDLITKALRLRYGDRSLRYSYPLASWTVERSSDQTGMVTLRTSDGFSVCFSMPKDLQQK